MIEGRIWAYVEPGADDEPILHTATDAEIIQDYFPYWCRQMRKVNRSHLINEDACIEDWVIVNWAWEVTA